MARSLNREVIRHWLWENRMTQGQLAIRAGVAQETMSRAMHARDVGIKLLFGLHEATGIPLDALIGTSEVDIKPAEEVLQ